MNIYIYINKYITHNTFYSINLYACNFNIITTILIILALVFQFFMFLSSISITVPLSLYMKKEDVNLFILPAKIEAINNTIEISLPIINTLIESNEDLRNKNEILQALEELYNGNGTSRLLFDGNGTSRLSSKDINHKLSSNIFNTLVLNSYQLNKNKQLNNKNNK